MFINKLKLESFAWKRLSATIISLPDITCVLYLNTDKKLKQFSEC